MLRTKRAALVGKIILVILLAYMVFMLVSVRQQISHVKTEIATLTEEVAEQTQANTELSNAIENRDDPSYLQDLAREKLNLVSPNDRVFYITD